MIRVWCLKTTAPVTILSGHTGQITSVKFCPLITKTGMRYLVSTANDGGICFWKWKAATRDFDAKPHKFTERSRPNISCHILTSSFSSGGVFLAVGSTDHYVRVYHVDGPAGPVKVLEIEAHSDQVDSLQFFKLFLPICVWIKRRNSPHLDLWAAGMEEHLVTDDGKKGKRSYPWWKWA